MKAVVTFSVEGKALSPISYELNPTIDKILAWLEEFAAAKNFLQTSLTVEASVATQGKNVVVTAKVLGVIIDQMEVQPPAEMDAIVAVVEALTGKTELDIQASVALE